MNESWTHRRDLTIEFDGDQLPGYGMSAGDYIRTGLSCKFTREGLEAELSRAGLRLLAWWTDAGGVGIVK